MLYAHKIFHSQVFFEKILDVCGLINDLECPTAGEHRDLDAGQKEERTIQEVMTIISYFKNPWRTPNKERLFSLASGAPGTADVLRAGKVREALNEDFIQNRLGNSSTKYFFNMLIREKLRTAWSMEDNNRKVSLTISKGKLI